MANFDIADLLKDMSALDTGIEKREEISYIDVSMLHADPNNFYSISGIEELCANIELLGLQQPIRVRAVDDGYMIVSGHRRTAAIRRLVNKGRNDLRLVPCIIEEAASSPELQELKLIYANSDTRILSSAELNRQAERVEELLYKLKDKGIVFTGRMRDHVAAACKMSPSKLARLKVIREGLKPEGLKAAYENGHLSETSAYEIARRSEVAQELAEEQRGFLCTRSSEEVSSIMDRLEQEAKRNSQIVKPYTEPPKKAVESYNDYLEKRYEEDLYFAELLKKFAPDFIYGKMAFGLSRKQNIDNLKIMLRGKGGVFVEYRYSATGGGLGLAAYGETMVLRTWTDVYDMLAAIAINELGKKQGDVDGKA